MLITFKFQDIKASYSVLGSGVPLGFAVAFGFTVLVVLDAAPKFIRRKKAIYENRIHMIFSFIWHMFNEVTWDTVIMLLLWTIGSIHIVLYWTFAPSSSAPQMDTVDPWYSSKTTLEQIYSHMANQIEYVRYVCPYVLFAVVALGHAFVCFQHRNQISESDAVDVWAPSLLIRFVRSAFSIFFFSFLLLTLLVGPQAPLQLLFLLLVPSGTFAIAHSVHTNKICGRKSDIQISWQLISSVAIYSLSVSRMAFFVTGHKLDFGSLQVL